MGKVQMAGESTGIQMTVDWETERHGHQGDRKKRSILVRAMEELNQKETLKMAKNHVSG